MNYKMVILSNWKLVLLVIQLSLLAITLATGGALARSDPIDNPGGP